MKVPLHQNLLLQRSKILCKFLCRYPPPILRQLVHLGPQRQPLLPYPILLHLQLLPPPIPYLPLSLLLSHLLFLIHLLSPQILLHLPFVPNLIQ